MKDHSLDGNLGLQHFAQMPGDSFSLAIFVGGQVERVGVGEKVFELRDLRLFLGRHDVQGREVVFDVDAGPRPRFFLECLGDLVRRRRQVADVSDRRFDDEILAQVFGDGFRLGR